MNIIFVALILAVVSIPFIAAIARAYRIGSKEVSVNSATDKTYETGRYPQGVAEVTFTDRHLVCKKGAATRSIIPWSAGGPPLGTVPDEPAIGDLATVILFGAASGTQRAVASKAIAESTDVYTTGAAGQLTDAAVSGTYKMGRTQPGSSAAAAGEEIVIIPCFPVLVP